jgi:hypothetical protein
MSCLCSAKIVAFEHRDLLLRFENVSAATSNGYYAWVTQYLRVVRFSRNFCPADPDRQLRAGLDIMLGV